MENISSSEENVILICCENHFHKDNNEGNINSYIISSIIYLKNKKKGTCRDNVFEYISDIHLINNCKKKYDTIIDKLLQDELICKRTYAKKETLNIVNSMQQLPEPEVGSENRNENLKEDKLHIRSDFVQLKAFIESEFIDIKSYVKQNIDNSSSTSQLERLICNMETEIVFLWDEIKNKNKIINNLLGNFSKPQNLSYNNSNFNFP